MIHDAWLPEAARAPLGARRISLPEGGGLLATLREEVAGATTSHGGRIVAADADAEVAFTLSAGQAAESFIIRDDQGRLRVTASDDRGLLAGYFHLLRLGEGAFGLAGEVRAAPSTPIRMLNHWDNMTRHPVMGTVERGYAGDSIFFHEGEIRRDLTRVAAYARLLASIGINHISINNVNVHRRETQLLTSLLPDVARVAAEFRRWGITLHLAVNFAAPIIEGGLATCDPYDPAVATWWRETTERVYGLIPDFGGYVVKADSEGQPGPFAYGRDHADGANLLARALAPHGGIVHWRAFVYNHQQDWRDRRTDRARAAHDHFTPLDGRFDDNVIVQIKHGPMDFQPREPVSPLIAAMPRTQLSLELQVTQEYTGQQQHVCYLGELWQEVLDFELGGEGERVRDLMHSVTAVSNVGTDEFWTGHPLAAANLYAYGRLAWDPTVGAADLAREWAGLTFPDDVRVAETVSGILLGSWQTYERYTAPLGVGFMVQPGHHYGPSVDGYEYSPWGTYHFADRDGVGVDRSVSSGTGYAGLYREELAQTYEDPATCPDELLLFFHHVPYTHRLHSGKTVIQHIYDTHFAGVEEVVEMRRRWLALGEFAGRGNFTTALYTRVAERLAEQERSATEWRDQINTYFHRASGIDDEHHRTIF